MNLNKLFFSLPALALLIMPSIALSAPRYVYQNVLYYDCAYRYGNEEYFAKGFEEFTVDDIMQYAMPTISFSNGAFILAGVQLDGKSSTSYKIFDSSSLVFPPGTEFGFGAQWAPRNKSAKYNSAGMSFHLAPSGYFEGNEVYAPCTFSVVRQKKLIK